MESLESVRTTLGVFTRTYSYLRRAKSPSADVEQLKIDWALQCFGRIWPKRVHGFGYGTEAALMRVPFHSADATSWEMGPCAFGRWKSFGGKLSVRQHHDITSEVVWYLEMERKVQARWRKEMAVLESLP